MREIRDPLYGMVRLTELEWDIVNSPPFQRLRRIRQLAFSDLVYPGAVHTRFEHSIGVMHLASEAFDHITAKSQAQDVLKAVGYDKGMYDCARHTIRLAALVHDLGHLPFSHAAEAEIMPKKSGTVACTHEDYSAALVREYLSDIILSHPDNAAYHMTAEDIVGLLVGSTKTPRLARLAPWRGLIVGQLDADRMDYLRRDSYHLGVEYGRFDVQRVLSTLTLVQDENDAPWLAIEEGGLLAAEALILARYFMFHQVYYHKVRRYVDHLYSVAFKEYLTRKGSGTLGPPEDPSALTEYLAFDDWKMQSVLRCMADDGCQDARHLLDRRAKKVLFEVDGAEKASLMDEVEQALKKRGADYWRDSGSVTATQTFSTAPIMVSGETSFRGVKPISTKSRVAMSVPARVYIERIYVDDVNRRAFESAHWLVKLRKEGDRLDEQRISKVAKT